MSDIWFRFRDDDGKSYYYNASTHETTWKFPVGKGTVWDADSKRKLKLPTQTKLKPPPQPKPPASESDEEESEKSKSEGSEASDNASQGSSESGGPEGPVVTDYSQELVNKWKEAKFDFAKFESEHMNKLKKDKFSNSDKPIDTPLLQSTKKADVKAAIRNYKLIMKQSGITPKGLKGNETLLDLIQSLNENSGLVDEAFAGLWKQTINCKRDMLNLLLDLFLILSTSFVPSSYLATPLLKHLASLGEDRYAVFVLIRLNDTFKRKAPLMKCKSDSDIKLILEHYKQGICIYGVSHYEAFFNQYRKRPCAQIPFIEYELLENVRNQGGRDIQSIFRGAGNKKLLDSLVQKANKGENVLEGLGYEEVAALFKRWLDFMPGKLISSSYTKEFNNATTDINDPDPAIEFANTLPVSIQVVLKYLVGYLRDFADNSSVNEMDLDAFATIFGRIITFEDDKQDVFKFQKAQAYFMKSLLDKWDIEGKYPVPEASMKAKK